MAYCAIDFGTSNSGIAVPDGRGGVTLVELEPGHRTMPTSVFYLTEGATAHEPLPRLYGRAALAAYVDGLDGRLMRSMKSILGSSLAEQGTDVGGGRSVRYADVISGYLRHLKTVAEAAAGAPLQQVVLGRPVRFVDDDDERDARAQATLETAARAVGFRDVSFQFEPIAAALHFEQSLSDDRLVLVADIGGGTSDFSLVRVGPGRRNRERRDDDILANHGVHVAGTDFDRHLELAAILPLAGYRGRGPDGREVPSRVYFDLATWHLVNTVYTPARVGELRRMRGFHADTRQHDRLMRIVDNRLGHALVAKAEAAKIELSAGGATTIDLDALEASLSVALDASQAAEALEADIERVVNAARRTAALAGVPPAGVQTLYFTGGSTGLTSLVNRIAAAFPQAQAVHGDHFASVSQGLGVHARRVYGVAGSPSLARGRGLG
jgi:hypothetical chaperone protein